MIGAGTTHDPGPAATPPSGTNPGSIDEQYWSAAIGPHQRDYYLPYFLHFEAHGIGPTWHWPAFFFTFWWLIYRKLWLHALLYWAAWAATTNLDSLLEDAGFTPVLSLVALVISFTFVPMYANALYYTVTRRRILRISARIGDAAQRMHALERAGGRSLLLFVLIAVLVGSIAAAILIPVYRDHTAREQLGEGIGLTYRYKTDLAQHYARMHTFAGFNTALPDYRTSGEFVASVKLLEQGPATLAVVATFRDDAAHAALRGREFRIATEDGGETWACGAAIRDAALRGDNGVPERLLPEQCR